ncbi:MAG: acetyl-CoA carboxylase biotin carboxyl carrier protein [Spirochaetaceae bacterium]|jgi:acetyl-CoA carboxylase biotin carboxyl carrier protein|nr:acetyl-CoA carboxylase biotin carboxyl carrier protein [Spirochaetaceae bacterium]
MNDESILKLLDVFSAADIAELDIQDGPQRVVFRKDAAVRAAIAPAPQIQAAADLPATARLPAEDGRAAFPESFGGETVASPIVATFYDAPGPDAPAFAKPGDRVKAGDTLCILEAMKMMNHLGAEFDCEILAVKARSGDLVEYGQALFEVRRL